MAESDPSAQALCVGMLELVVDNMVCVFKENGCVRRRALTTLTDSRGRDKKQKSQ